MTRLKTVFALVALASASCASGASLTSSPFVLDTIRTRTAASSIMVGYSPRWADGAADDATVTVEQVFYLGMEQVSTSTVVSATSAEGVVYVTADSEGAGMPTARRLVLRIERDGATLGEYMHDVGFGVSGASSAFDADSRTNALQLAVDSAPASVPLAYSTGWAEGAVAQRLDVVTRTHARRTGVEVTTTNTVASFTGAGILDWNAWRVDGCHTLLLTSLDANGDPLGDPLSARFEVVVPIGTTIILR